jgi:hypothetical protein
MKLVEAVKTRWIVWVWNHTPNCAEMSRLASVSFEQPVSVKVRLKMRLHYLICVWCQRYSKHLKFLHRAAPQLQDQLDSVTSGNLSDEAKQRMKKRLSEIHGH